MKSILVLLLTSCFASVVVAQDTLSIASPTKPSVRELIDEFVAAGQGSIDPFVVLPKVIQWEDSVVSPLSQILSTNLQPGISSTKELPLAARLYAAMALEAIGTDAAYGVLFAAARSNKDSDVRGYTLQALAITFHNQEWLERTQRDKELVHLLLQNVDDTTNVRYFQKSFGQIAREGMMNWTGWDTGEPRGLQTKVMTLKGGNALTLYQQREEWWRDHGAKLSWDVKTGRFLLAPSRSGVEK